MGATARRRQKACKSICREMIETRLCFYALLGADLRLVVSFIELGLSLRKAKRVTLRIWCKAAV